jgi:drug/metabolite transporter (DMT)-like permease
MKQTLARYEVYSFLAVRFIIATLVLIILRPKALRQISKQVALRGIILGLFLGGGYIFQTLGLTHTTVAKTGFITGLYAILTPLLSAALLRKRVSILEWGCVALAATGLALLSFNGLSIGLGEALVLISALLFSFHILGLSEWSSGENTYQLTIFQLGTTGLLCLIASLPGGFRLPPDAGVWQALIFTALFASAFAFIIQTWVQSFMSATSAAIILTMEYIFAAIGGVVYGGERLGLRIAIGGALVITAQYVIIWNESKSGTLPPAHLE